MASHPSSRPASAALPDASSTSPHGRVLRTRPVSFGNPALGTYRGNVYTIPNGIVPPASSRSLSSTPSPARSQPPLVEDAESVERMVAIIDVPPEHVPEGILSLVRSHRPFIEHVRIVIAEMEGQGGDSDHHRADNGDSDGDAPFRHAQDAGPPNQGEGGGPRQGDGEDAGESLGGAESGRTYLVLFRMADEGAAATFVDDLDGKPYIAFDDQDVCHVEHVVALQGQDGVSLLDPHFAPAGRATHPPTDPSPSPSPTLPSPAVRGSLATPGHAENCAVCLERMELYGTDAGTSGAGAAAAAGGENDTSKTAILTTVCNHTFHLDCLRQCSGPCPVCRYDHSGLNETLSQCHICGTTEHNYVCLICGVVSCVGVPTMAGRAASRGEAGGGGGGGLCVQCGDSNGHAAAAAGRGGAPEGAAAGPDGGPAAASEGTAHRFYTSHAGQHYNDTLHAYALDTETQHVYDFAGQGYVHRLVQNKEDGKLVEINDPHSNSQERSLTPGLSDAQEGEVVHRKLEGFASQYYTTLKSQLEQQRSFYEGRLQEIRRDFAIKERNHEKAKRDLVAALRQERKQLSHRLSSHQRRRDKLLEDSAFLKSMNESLEANQPGLQHRIQQAQRERIESRDMIQKHLPALEEKLTTLMLQLEESMESAPRIG